MPDLTLTQSKLFAASLFGVAGFMDWLVEKVASIVCPMLFVCAGG